MDLNLRLKLEDNEQNEPDLGQNSKRDVSEKNMRQATNICYEARRDFLKSAGAVLGAASLGLMAEGCALPTTAENFYANFNPDNFKPIDESERREYSRNIDYSPKKHWILTNKINEEFKIKLPLEDLIEFVKVEDYSGEKKPERFAPKIKFYTREIVEEILEKNNVEYSNFFIDAHSDVFTLKVFGSNSTDYIMAHFNGEGFRLEGTGLNADPTEVEINLENNGKAASATRQKMIPNGDSTIFVSTKNFVVANNDETGDFDLENGYFYKNRNDEIVEINNVENLLYFLKNCQNEELIRSFFRTTFAIIRVDISKSPFFIQNLRCDFSDLKNEKQLREIMTLLPKDYHCFSGLLKLIFGFKNDYSDSDQEFGNPVETLRYLRGDSDNFALLNYLWADMNGYEAYLVGLKSGSIYRRNSSSRNFVWFKNEEDRIVIMHQTDAFLLEEGQTVEDFVKKYFKMDITFEERM